MAFFTTPLDDGKVPVPRGTVAGRKSLPINPTPYKTSLCLEERCAGCPSLNAHKITNHVHPEVPPDVPLQSGVPEAMKITAFEINQIQTILHLLHFIGNGVITDPGLWNAAPGSAADGADNPAQSINYKILAAVDEDSGGAITVQGPNPKHVAFTQQVINPNWPFLAPEDMKPPGMSDEDWDGSAGLTPEDEPPYFPGQGWAFYIPKDIVMTLAIGSLVQYGPKLVLRDKSTPRVIAIDVPETDDLDDVIFTIHVDQSVENYDEPADGDTELVSADISLSVWWDALYPDAFAHITDYRQAWFAERTVYLETGELHTLTDSQGNNTRVLWPGMMTGAAVAFVCEIVDDDTEDATVERTVDVLNEVSSVTGNPLLVTEELSHTSWKTTLDLRGLESEGPFCRVTYWAKAHPQDQKRVPFQGTCSNSFADEDYAQKDGRRCAVPSASGFADFAGHTCWRPGFGGCDHFATGHADLHEGPATYMPDRFTADFWGSLWTRESWYLRQISNEPTYLYSKAVPGGPSIMSLLGRFVWEVPIMAQVMHVYPAFQPIFGERFVTTNSTDGTQHWLLHGAFCREGRDFTIAGGDDLRYKALIGNEPNDEHPGIVSAAVPDWTLRNDPLNDSIEPALKEYPDRIGQIRVGGSYESFGQGFQKSNHKPDHIMDGAVVDVKFSDVDIDLNAKVQSLFT